MNFAFDEEQRSLGETVAAAIADLPALVGPDPSTASNEAAWETVAQLGLFSLLIPAEHDGVGLRLIDLALAIEALGAGLAPPVVASTLIATDALIQHGSASQKESWFPRIAAGEVKIALAIVEEGADYALESLSTTAEQGALTGSKLLVAGGSTANAFLVVGKYAGEPACWLVDATTAGIGIELEKSIDPSADLAAVTFSQVVADRLQPGSAENLENVGAIVTAGMMTGIASKMLDASVSFVSTREQFGQPIGAFQAIKHRCADMAVAVEAARSAAYYAFWAVSENGEDNRRAASMAKAYCGDVSRSVCNETIQVHGGMGFTWDLGLHRYLRRSKLFEHQFGDATFHRERVVAATLMAAATVSQHRDAA